ncbi:hypothetical protein ACFX11_036455 [Malus domestica]
MYLGSLENLILDFNELTGSIPIGLSNCTNLNWISLANNKLSGEVPGWIGKLPNLAILKLSNNSFFGSIPPELGDCKSLIWLDLNTNMLNGTIPPVFFKQSGNIAVNFVASKTYVYIKNDGSKECHGAGNLLEFAGIRTEQLNRISTRNPCNFTRVYRGILQLIELQRPRLHWVFRRIPLPFKVLERVELVDSVTRFHQTVLLTTSPTHPPPLQPHSTRPSSSWPSPTALSLLHSDTPSSSPSAPPTHPLTLDLPTPSFHGSKSTTSASPTNSSTSSSSTPSATPRSSTRLSCSPKCPELHHPVVSHEYGNGLAIESASGIKKRNHETMGTTGQVAGSLMAHDQMAGPGSSSSLKENLQISRSK